MNFFWHFNSICSSSIHITITNGYLNAYGRVFSPARKFGAVERDVKRLLLSPDASKTFHRLATFNVSNHLVGKKNIRMTLTNSPRIIGDRQS